MSLFAISDLHLGFAVDKPMDRFGSAWEGHAERIARAWHERVRREDTVLVCGDTSWAMRLDEAIPDLEYLTALPGRKVLLRGNHDYWWSSRAKLRRLLPDDVLLLQNDAHAIEGWQVCGSRGWVLPGPETSEADRRIYARELERLRRSLEAAGSGPRLAMLHYPPYDVATGSSEVLDLLIEYGVQVCVYGHLHAMEAGTYPEGEHAGIRFHCVSVDLIDFAPRRLELPPSAENRSPGGSTL